MPLNKELKDALAKAVTELPVNAAPQAEIPAVEPVYFDRSEVTNEKWRVLAAKYLKTAKSFEIHCWNDESEWIRLALQCGQEQKTDWSYGKVISGAVTEEFRAMLLSIPKPEDTEIYNKMTPFFNVFLDNGFESSHYGTEVYLKGGTK